MNYLEKPYVLSDLESLQVGAAAMFRGDDHASLRAHVRRGIENGEIETALTGVQIAGLNKQGCIALLMNGSMPKQQETENTFEVSIEAAPTVAAAASPTVKGADAVASALSVLQAAFGGNVSAEDVKRQVAEHVAPHLQSLAGIQAILENSAKDNAAKVAAMMASFEAEADKLRAEMLAGKPVRIEVMLPDGTLKECDRQHYLFPLVIKVLEARCHPYFAGPAGSFKTSTAHAAANALGMKFYAISVCAQTTKTDLLGFFVPGTGEYRATDFRRAFEHGGVFVVDEVDAGNANVLAVLNAALANSQMGFPDGMIARHADFVLIAAGNTYGQGADRLYVGRNQLDAATLDRFCFIDFPYDTGLEAEYCGIKGCPSPAFNLNKGGSVTADGWLEFVHKVRASAEKQKIRAVISTRASIYGVKLAERGIGREHLENMLIWKGLDDATCAKIKAGMK